MIKVMAFGVFDILHDGHRSFLKQAKSLGDFLIVAVAQDAVVERLKNRRPRHPLAVRMAEIKKNRLADEVVSGDVAIGDWGVLRTHTPDIIAIGYDQNQLRLELETYIKKNNIKTEIRVMKFFQTGRLHNSDNN